MLFPFFVYSYPGNSIYNLDIDLIDKDGKELKLKDFNGKVQVFQ
ncbi:MAG TPA: hypothetical protein ACYCC8_01185 [Candidatus Azoamicus sp.]